MTGLNAEFVATLGQVYGTAGKQFAADLTRLLAGCEQRFRITVGEPYELSYHYVCRAVRADGTPCVLKIAPLHPENRLRAEADVLRLVDGAGAVRVLDEDQQLGALLLEAADPGDRLSDLVLAGRDEEATAIAAGVLAGFRSPPPWGSTYDTVEQFAEAFDRHRVTYGGSGPLPEAAFAHAASLYTDLAATQADRVLLHGDLHHDNILAARLSRPGTAWLAIDPKGVVGEPAYEVGALLRNPMPGLLTLPDPARLVARRVAQLAELLDLPVERVRGWGVAVNALSAVWGLADPADTDRGWQHAWTCAEIIAGLPG